MTSEIPAKQTVLRLSRRDLLLLLVGGPLLGAVLGVVLPPLADWMVELRWVPMRGPFELLSSLDGGLTLLWCALAGLLLGLGLATLAVLSCLKVTVSAASVRAEKDDNVRVIAREDIDAVFLDGKRLVILDQASRQLLCETIEARPEDVARAFTAHGYPWTATDPFAELYRRWVPDTPDLPAAANAVLKARENALKKKAADDAAELRDEVQKLGFVVRDDAAKQYWRPLVRP